MKKIISLLVCLVLVFSLSISAFAAGSAKVNSDASADVIKVGDTVVVTVSLSDCAPFKSMALTPNYDKNVFEMVSGEWLLDGAALSNFNGTSAAIAYSNAVEKSGDIFKYVLKVKDNATLKNTTIKTDVVIKNGSTVIVSTANATTVKVICKTHSFGAWSKADNNNHKHTCTACGTAESSAHTWNGGTITKAATCKETGVKTYTCTVCNATKTEAISTTTNHTFGNWTQTKEPTCTAKGTESRTCSICQKVETKDIAAKGHSMGKWTTAKEATCEEKGSQTRTCSKCSHKETKDIKALGHKFSNPTVTKEPTCSEEGIESGKCTRCDKETTNTLPKKEHTFGEAVVVTPATETAVGKQTKTCTVCNTVVEEEIPMLDKNDVETNVEPDDTVNMDNSDDVSENENSSWIIWVILGAVILVCGGVTAVILIKKKR
jgi:hypothetical protein